MSTLAMPRPVLRLQRPVAQRASAAADQATAAVVAPAPAESTAAGLLRSINSATMLGTAKVVNILHNGSVYQLKTTKLGKLILTK
ncbi:hemin uptake protein HemP [Acidovorax soli]|uniref:Hemin uptake protein HemP n=1 Tax=Acidovorax soli TaxID=592050 RepID=A0A7X0PBM8_9BURK|nr:hemin uptake protein HemP [Acidovorax soli]MBB6558923.1 hemin uptake protein HemP [Acidovorax soli]